MVTQVLSHSSSYTASATKGQLAVAPAPGVERAGGGGDARAAAAAGEQGGGSHVFHTDSYQLARRITKWCMKHIARDTKTDTIAHPAHAQAPWAVRSIINQVFIKDLLIISYKQFIILFYQSIRRVIPELSQ